MITIPKLFRKTKTVRQIQAYMDSTFSEVLHTTLNPDGPGAIRVHLIPPKAEENALNPSVAIVNGTDIVRSVNSVDMTNRTRAEAFIEAFVLGDLDTFVIDLERDGEPTQHVYVTQ